MKHFAEGIFGNSKTIWHAVDKGRKLFTSQNYDRPVLGEAAVKVVEINSLISSISI